MILSALLFLAQAPTMTPQMPTAPLPIPRAKPAPAPTAPPREVATGPLAECLALVRRAPLDALEVAENWAMTAKGAPRVGADHCRGAALVALARWGEAETAFYAAHDMAPEPAARARFAAMAGNAALAGGAPERAEAEFATAESEARGAAQTVLAGEIAIDRARALVALGRLDAAGAALARGRSDAPDSALGWLLSATLARREGKLAEAQAWIERAAERDPRDPAIGLEAGVIAARAGRIDSARKAWAAVIAIAGDGPEGASAKTNLAALDAKP